MRYDVFVCANKKFKVERMMKRFDLRRDGRTVNLKVCKALVSAALALSALAVCVPASALAFVSAWAPQFIGTPGATVTSVTLPSGSVGPNDLIVVWSQWGASTTTDSAGNTYQYVVPENLPSSYAKLFYTVTNSPFTGSLTVTCANGIGGIRVYSGYSHASYVAGIGTANPYPTDTTTRAVLTSSAQAAP